MVDTRGVHFNQQSLKSDLESISAGQSASARTILVLFLFLACALSGFLTSFYSANAVVAWIANPLETRLSFSIIWIVIVVWLITVIRRSPKINLLVPLCILLIGIAVQQWCIHVYPEQFKRYTWVDVLYDLLPPFTITIVGFFAVRFSSALIDVLWHKSVATSIKAMSLFVVAIASVFGAYSALSIRLSRLAQAGKTLESEQQSIILSSGVLFACAVALSAWAANRARNAPWDSTGFLHSLVLSMGAWRGTSFYDLDLSHTNFRGANLANSDLRARKLYRTCFQGVIGLDRAKLDHRYLDLELPKVQHLLTQGYAKETHFRRLNLRGAYLQNADLRRLDFTDTDLTGSDFKNADLRGAILVRANVTGVDFSDANLTGICIQDWNVNRETLFTNVACDYIYRKVDEQGEPTERYPADRNFDDREFESLYQEVGNVVDLVFKEGINWRAFAFTLQKLQIEDEGLGLELKGIEKRGDLWIVKVTHNENIPTAVVERHLMESYERLQVLLAEKEQQITKLLDIASDQAEAVKTLSKQPFGNNFFISGSSITNLAGSGQIDYREAASGVRSLVTNRVDPHSNFQRLIRQLSHQNVATTAATQREFIQEVLLSEAERDPDFQRFLLEQGEQIVQSLPNEEITIALQSAIQTLQKN